MMKIRTLPESNYRSFFLDNGKTFRVPVNPNEPITELEYPEFYDIKITDTCSGGCGWCYQNSTPNAKPYENAVSNLKCFFKSFNENENHKPFQIAFGGGEPTESPHFKEIMQLTYNEGIIPNFTTNGQWTTRWSLDKITDHLNTTREFCGGVAISTHHHLDKAWKHAVELYRNNASNRLNLHIIISGEESIIRMKNIIEEYHSKIDYFVLLPWMSVGRAENREINYDFLDKTLPREYINQIAWGANFYDFLKDKQTTLDISLFEPEMFSKYIDLKDNGSMYRSSFSTENPIKTEMFIQ